MSTKPSAISQPDVDPVTGVVVGAVVGTTTVGETVGETVGDTVGGAELGGGTVVVDAGTTPPGPIVAICSLAYAVRLGGSGAYASDDAASLFSSSRPANVRRLRAA